jgi:hypothetical protein
MKLIFIIGILLASFTLAVGQNEQAPILEKEIEYKNWTYRDVRTGADRDLRDYTKGKRLTIVVYYAPWCPNWRHDAPMLQRFYDKYKSYGLEIVAIGEYDPVASMKTNLETLKITFPAVYESELRTDRLKTTHNQYRTATGDTRGWASPWYVFLLPSRMEKKGDVVTKKTFIINGEMIEGEGEKFIRENLGLPPLATKTAVADKDKVEPCDPDKKTADLKMPCQ